MKIIPAIDLRGGKVVRLIQGAIELETIYSDSPIEVAERWASYGVELIHVVDLDGAIEGQPRNFEIVKAIAKKVSAKVELGGGIRNEEDLKKVFDAGIEKAVLGTRALDEDFIRRSVELYKDRIVIAIDAKHGVVHTKGWLFKTKITAVELAKRAEAFGVKTVNYTDITKDGMLEGPNIESMRLLAKSSGLDVIASGGVSSIEDVLNLKKLESDGLKGMIIGKALYEKKLDLKEAIKICSQRG